MPYLTPQELPESDTCRSLSIPDDTEWLALFGGALTELIKNYNWEYSGGLTIDETVEKMTDIINNWYSDPCAACTTPGGYRVIRIGAGGHLEQLDEDGNWEPATDDYAIPPPEAREGGSPDDQICLAAKNAVNVLEQLYEAWTTYWDDELSLDEAITAAIAFLISLVPFAFAPIVWAIAALLLPVFAAFYAAMNYLTADLWDEDFSNQMICFLVNCASNDAGVVTFDYDCFVGELNSLADSFGLTEIQIRLYLQVSYLLYFIGGVDGLNLAASTTDITNDDCSFCPSDCAIEVHFDDPDLYEFITRIPGITATLDTGFGHPLPSAAAGTGLDVGVPAFSCDVETDLGSEQLVIGTIFEYYYNRSDSEGIYLYVKYYDDSHTLITTNDDSKTMMDAPYDQWNTYIDDVGCAGARYVQYGFGGENTGLTAEGWLDTVCIKY